MSKNGANEVEAYIAQASEPARSALGLVRDAIRSVAPDASETIAYGMPAFASPQGTFLSFGAFSRHIGFYPGAATIAAFADELSGYRTAKGSIQFPLAKPMPIALVKRLAQFRAKLLL
jgi:uncharacterized protein YdhG (YjbR/CyaY superfamily)